VKIVFIQPNVGFKGGHTWEALGIGYMVSYLKKHFQGSLDLSFYSAFYDSDEEIIRNVQDADVIAFSCTSPQYRHGLQLARVVKKPDNTIVFGGVHASALPDDVLKEPCVDIVVKGEGEQSILSIINDLSSGNKNRKRIITSDYIEDINTIPFPDRIAIKNERNIQQAYADNHKRIAAVLSSRGCPFRCSYCCSPVVWQRKTRFRSPENILDEIEEMVRVLHLDFLKFADDTFTVNKKRVLDFCSQKNERGIAIPFGANAHINTIDEEMLKVLSESNCQELWYGVESGSPKILNDMHKNTNIEDIQNVFRLTHDYGMKTRAYFLIGMPNETIEDLHLTEQLCDEIQPDVVGFTLLAPYPTNEYFDYATMKDWDWSTFDEYTNDWVHTQTLSNARLKSEQKRLIEKYQKNITFKQKGETE
jgi:anaerobic magnesium-protoporphyrin IX monomethyl ester cyclase